MLRAVTLILTLMWLGLLIAPAALRDVVGLAGVGGLLAVLAVDRWRAVHDGHSLRKKA